ALAALALQLERRRRRGNVMRGAVWLAFTAAATLWFVAAAARDLPNFRPISNDEGELIEVSHVLANYGVLGSNLFAGCFGAESHHLWTLPPQHVLDAVAFRMFGEGIAQARWVSVVAAVAVLWSVGWLARRWFGLAAAVASEVLLIAWRSNLTDGPTGLPLLDVARVARYDVLAVAFAWLAFVALDAMPRPRLGAFVAGVCAGLAALSQFFGIFVLPVLLLNSHCKSRWRWLLFGTAVVVAPWLVYVAIHAGDLGPQL